jgi:hypothetical protein
MSARASSGIVLKFLTAAAAAAIVMSAAPARAVDP